MKFLLNLIIGPIFRHRFYKYNINDEYIDIVEGYISVSRQIVPIERIHKLEMDAGPFARMFGLADITITTAGGDVLISYIESHRAEEIADKLRKRINNIVIEHPIHTIVKATERITNNLNDLLLFFPDEGRKSGNADKP